MLFVATGGFVFSHILIFNFKFIFLGKESLGPQPTAGWCGSFFSFCFVVCSYTFISIFKINYITSSKT